MPDREQLIEVAIEVLWRTMPWKYLGEEEQARAARKMDESRLAEGIVDALLAALRPDEEAVERAAKVIVKEVPWAREWQAVRALTCAALEAAGPVVVERSKPGEPHPMDRAFYELAVKERDYERKRADRLERERDEAIAEVERLKERERHFASVICVTDGGRYRNDWDSRLERLLRIEQAARAVVTQAGGWDFQDGYIAALRTALDEGSEG